MTVPEEALEPSLVTGNLAVALSPSAGGLGFSSDDDTSESLDSSLLSDELVSLDVGSFATG